MTPHTRHSTLLTKVPEVTAIFWLTKVLTTGVGESTSDFLVKQVGKGGAVFLGTITFAGALIWQFKTSGYTPGVYWLAVAMVAVFGTLAADAVHVGLGVPYYASSTLYAVILAGIFVAWYRTEGTLSIHSIYTPRREVFYWLAVLATFALGTAVGDLTARSFGWGYLSSAVVFGCAIAVPAIAYWRTNLNPILIFWTAYVLTRPLGASLADWLGKNHDIGGLGLGDGTVSVAGALLIVGLVSYLARNQRAISPDLRPQPQERARLGIHECRSSRRVSRRRDRTDETCLRAGQRCSDRSGEGRDRSARGRRVGAGRGNSVRF